MSASPAPNSGSGASSYTSCSGPPCLWSRTAFILVPLLIQQNVHYFRRDTPRRIGAAETSLPIRAAALRPCVRNFMTRCQEQWPRHEIPRTRLNNLGRPKIRPRNSGVVLSVRICTRIPWPLLVIGPVIGTEDGNAAGYRVQPQEQVMCPCRLGAGATADVRAATQLSLPPH